jgi:hypothetical protein
MSALEVAAAILRATSPASHLHTLEPKSTTALEFTCERTTTFFVNVWLEQHLSPFAGLAFLEEHEPHVIQTLYLERLRTTTCALARLSSSF